jgi:hypothetical protein
MFYGLQRAVVDGALNQYFYLQVQHIRSHVTLTAFPFSWSQWAVFGDLLADGADRVAEHKMTLIQILT